MPGSIQTRGSFARNSYQATSTYVPGPTIVSGTHDRQLAVSAQAATYLYDGAFIAVSSVPEADVAQGWTEARPSVLYGLQLLRGQRCG